MKRPRISIVANYKINTKAAHNHFQRYSDVKAKGQDHLGFLIKGKYHRDFEPLW